MHLADASHFEEKAREAYLDDDFESSVDSYTKAVDLEPSADLFADRAQAYIKLGNFTEAVSDANEAIGLNPSLVKAYLRKGSACMKLGEYHTAKEALEKGSSLSKNDSRFAKLIEECQKHLRDEVTELEMPNTSLNAPSSVATLSSDEKATADQENETGHDMLQQVTLDEPSSVATVSSDEKDMADQENETGHNMLQEVNAVTHDFYQKPEVVVVTIFAKGVAADEVSIDFGEQILSVGINKKGEDAYHFQPRLYGKIKPENCKYQILSAKIEIHLAKAEAIDWRSLEYSKEAAAPQRISVSSVGSQRPAYPSSKGKAADWDKLEAQVKQEEKDEKLDGDAALNKLFRDIFQNADEDMRRAMTKSFVESNGTVLSTNWKEVGAKKVESSPPDGMELKKWEI